MGFVAETPIFGVVVELVDHFGDRLLGGSEQDQYGVDGGLDGGEEEGGCKRSRCDCSEEEHRGRKTDEGGGGHGLSIGGRYHMGRGEGEKLSM